ARGSDSSRATGAASAVSQSLSPRDALPIYLRRPRRRDRPDLSPPRERTGPGPRPHWQTPGQILDAQRFFEHRRRQDEQKPEQLRSEEHTSELQSRENLVCRLLLEKKKART